jgi:hypothetical protein
MTGNTGLLTARCDPYGAESSIRLLGGMFPEDQVGRIKWHCQLPAVARFRMICTGGRYGTRVAPGGELEHGYICEGGHRGQPMALCADHRMSIGRRQAGLCPACAFPPAARTLTEALQARQADMHNAWTLGMLAAAAKLGAAVEDLTGQMTELSARGLIHKCPLKLVEVS